MQGRQAWRSLLGAVSCKFEFKSNRAYISARHTLLSEVKPGCIQYHIPIVACASIAYVHLVRQIGEDRVKIVAYLCCLGRY